jgi:branched-chain amino acid aminotransferase
MNQHALCWINGHIQPAHQAHISVYDHGLLYGDGVFEGLRFYYRKTFMLQAHLQRLQQSAQAIALELPYSLEQIQQAIEQLIQRYPDDSGYLRLVITRGKGSLGIDPLKCDKASLFIIADELSVVNSQHLEQGIKLHIATTKRTPAVCLDPKIKSLNYLNNILARIEANHAGMDEALMLNLDGYVSEGSVDNIFIISNGALKTPPLNDGLLAGITREVIIDIAQEMEISCDQTSLTVQDLQQADECFLTGTGAELIKVSQIDQHVYKTLENPLMPKIRAAFQKRIDLMCGKAG